MDTFAPKREDDYGDVHVLENGEILELVRSGVQQPSVGTFSFKDLTWTWRIPYGKRIQVAIVPWEKLEDFIKCHAPLHEECPKHHGHKGDLE